MAFLSLVVKQVSIAHFHVEFIGLNQCDNAKWKTLSMLVPLKQLHRIHCSIYIALMSVSHQPLLTPSINISGCNNVKSGGPTSIYNMIPTFSGLEPDGKFGVMRAVGRTTSLLALIAAVPTKSSGRICTLLLPDRN